MIQSIALSDIIAKGELAVRTNLNYARLEGKWYRPDEIFTADQHGWPADWEGRCMLALVLLAQTTRRHPAYIDEMIDLLPRNLNAKGYLGQILPEGVNDEQQLAGHNWLLRALIEYHTWKEDDRSLACLTTLVNNLFLKALGNYRRYPIDPQTRFESDHWKLSKLQTKSSKHAETSDCGCAFIPLDGLTHAYELLQWPELKSLIEEMIEKYREIDFTGLRVQTHATLSGLRGILKFHELTGEKAYLDLAIRVFDLYKAEAWTEEYANYNWFGHPRWTELCAIVDSLMVATCLWRHTSNPAYIEDLQHIYYNAFCHHQRTNGGFGSDNCAGARDGHERQFATPNNYETFWCCTMRAGEGFARLTESLYFIGGDSVYLPFYSDSTATLRLRSGTLTVEQKTKYPYDGIVRLEVTGGSAAKASFNFFAGSWTTAASLTLNDSPVAAEMNDGFLTVRGSFKKGDVFVLSLDMQPFTVETTLKNNIQPFFSFRFGPMVLAYKRDSILESENFINAMRGYEKSFKCPEPARIPRNAKLDALGHARFGIADTDFVISPLCDIKTLTREDSADQILFDA